MIGIPATLPSRSPAGGARSLPADLVLPLTAVALVALPVFVQAPLVRTTPVLAALFTLPLVTAGVLLQRSGTEPWQHIGALLVGFSGSWLAGCLFWGWFRTHPACHLPLEACLLPLALGGLGNRWQLAAAFYLSSLVGTALTDIAIALTGLMPLWPQVLEAPLPEAPLLLHQAGRLVLQPFNLLLVSALAVLLIQACRWFWQRGPIGRVAAATLAATLGVDGLFLGAALLAPRLSGLI